MKTVKKDTKKGRAKYLKESACEKWFFLHLVMDVSDGSGLAWK